MTFQRSAGALHSMHLFYRVDVVAFCEGGRSTSIQEALSTSFKDTTLDTVYWSRTVEIMSVGKTVYFKSIGGKATILQIARMVEDEQCKNVSVCIDSDYDEILMCKYNGTRVCYTRGYSWESDVLDEDVLPQILKHFVGVLHQEIITELGKRVDLFKNSLSEWSEIDVALRKKNKPCVLDREKPHSIVDHTQDWPGINVDRLKERLRQCGYKRKPRIEHRVATEDAMRVTYGKAISAFMYHLVVTMAKKLNAKIRIDYDNFMRVAIAETFSLMARGGLEALRDHIMSRRLAFV